MEDFIEDEDNVPPSAQRYLAVWITLAIVLLPLVAWSLLK